MYIKQGTNFPNKVRTVALVIWFYKVTKVQFPLKRPRKSDPFVSFISMVVNAFRTCLFSRQIFSSAQH